MGSHVSDVIRGAAQGTGVPGVSPDRGASHKGPRHAWRPFRSVELKTLSLRSCPVGCRCYASSRLCRSCFLFLLVFLLCPVSHADSAYEASCQRHRLRCTAHFSRARRQAGFGHASLMRLTDLVAGAASVLAATAPPPSADGAFGATNVNSLPNAQSLQIQRVAKALADGGGAIQAGADTPLPGAPPLHIVAVLNPLTRAAQRLSQLLLFLKQALSPSITLVLNPQRDLSDMPLKSYYRFALPRIARDPDTGLLAPAPAAGGEPAEVEPPGSAAATFSRLPGRRVLTLNMEVPEPWLVMRP